MSKRSDEEWDARKRDAKIRELLSSNSSDDNGEELQRQPMHADLVNGTTQHNENITVEELFEGSFKEEDRSYYSDEEWYKTTDWWKVAVAKAKRESGEGDRDVEAAPEVSLSPRSKDQVIDKMIQVMERLERKTKELEDRLEAAGAKII
jgi:hypothetical protein